MKWRNGEVAKWSFPISLLRYFAIFLLLSSGCTESYTPKPRGYYRIDLPEHTYRLFDSTYPYSFEYPVYADISADSTKMAEPYWINIRFHGFNATLHFSYKSIDGNLARYLEDAHTLVNKHIPKASAITQKEYVNAGKRVFGLAYDIRGADAASPYQFYLTDSLTKFVRGALYFNHTPNNDSLAPVIDFLKKDLEHMVSTFRWKNPKGN